MKKISVIVPCYQNEGSIPILADKLVELEKKLADRARFSYVLVNDGSTDNTLPELLDFKNRLPDRVKVVKLARNFGSYNAFLAGMTYSKGDCHVYLHADLQDPPELIEDMLGYFEKGNRLVIAYRQDREDGSFFASLYHKMVKRFAIRNIPPGGFDLMLFDEQIRGEVVAISEKNTNIVYLISWLGHPYVAIPYTRRKREHGVSQWRFKRKARLFVDTFFSFSELPLYICRALSMFSVLVSLALVAGLIYSVWRNGFGTPELILSGLAVLSFCMGIITGILGEYLNRIHETVRKRPNFVVDEVI